MFCSRRQQAHLPNASLKFAPKVKAPFALPVLLPGVLGVLSSTVQGEYSLRLTVGELRLSLLEVDGKAAPGESVQLAAGCPPVQWGATLEGSSLCTQAAKTNCVGNDIPDSPQKTKTAAECCAHCNATTGCAAWTWNGDGNKFCNPKTACPSPTVNRHTTSGGSNFPPGPAPPTPTPPTPTPPTPTPPAPPAFPWLDPSVPTATRV